MVSIDVEAVKFFSELLRGVEMKVLFAHDGPLYTDRKGNYYGVHLTDDLRIRYAYLADHVTFLMRVYSLNDHLNNFTQIRNENFEVVEVPNFKSIRLFLRNYFKAKHITQKAVQNHDIIVARLPSAIGTLAVNFALKYNKPLLVEYVACTFDAYWNYNWKGRIIAHYKMLMQKRIMRKVSYAIYVTNKFLQERYPTNGQYISCSDVELLNFNGDDLQKRLTKIQDASVYPPVIGTVAALDVPYKGQADVIKAIALLKKENKLYQYHLVGQGDAGVLKRLIKSLGVEDLVKIIGPLKHKEVFNFYQNIDIYIQPSKQEGLPRAMVEAMSKACPALGARTAGIPELVDDDMIFDKGNIVQIAEKIKNLTKEKMYVQARRNFLEAMRYKKDILEQARIQFYNKFLMETTRLKRDK